MAEVRAGSGTERGIFLGMYRLWSGNQLERLSLYFYFTLRQRFTAPDSKSFWRRLMRKCTFSSQNSPLLYIYYPHRGYFSRGLRASITDDCRDLYKRWPYLECF